MASKATQAILLQDVEKVGLRGEVVNVARIDDAALGDPSGRVSAPIQVA